jgi:hypothetical protein
MVQETKTLGDLGDLKGSAKAAAPAEAPVHVQKLDKLGRAYATGKRKDAVARVWIKPGKGLIQVNAKDFAQYFVRTRCSVNSVEELTAHSMRRGLGNKTFNYARVVANIERLTGEPIAGIHVVGGGSKNAYLNQATADATGKPVLAGPVEATAAGNVIVQAVAAGRLASIAEGRAALARGVALTRFEPRKSDVWTELRARLGVRART